MTLDDLMRAMWQAYGKPGGPEPGLVGKTYTIGDTVEIVFVRRNQQVRSVATLADPTKLELLTLESTGASITPEQKQFRDAWLESKAK